MGAFRFRKRTIWLSRFFLIAFVMNFSYFGQSQPITERFKGSDTEFEKIITALRGFNPPISEEKTEKPFVPVANKFEPKKDLKPTSPTRSHVQLKGEGSSSQSRKPTSCIIKVKTNPAPPQRPLKPSKLPKAQISFRLNWTQGFYPKGLVVRFSLYDKKGNHLGEKDFIVPEDPKWDGNFSLKDLPAGSLVKASIFEREDGKLVSPIRWQLKKTGPFGPLKAGREQEMVVEIFRVTTDIALSVTNEEGQPISDLKLNLSWLSKDKKDGKPERKIASTDSKGLALFQKVPLGAEVDYFLESEDWEIVKVGGMEIRPGKATAVRLVVAPTKRDFTVHVLSTKQKPVPNLKVRLEWVQEGERGELEAETDGEGKAIFPKVPVRAGLTCFVEDEEWEVVDKKENPLTLIVRPTKMSLSIQCLDEKGQPIKNLPITLIGFQRREGTDQIICAGDMGERATDERGVVSFEKAPTNLILQIRSLDPRWEVIEGNHQLPPYEDIKESEPLKVKLRKVTRALQVVFEPTPNMPITNLKARLFEVDPETMKEGKLIEERDVEGGKATFSPQPVDGLFKLELAGEGAINWEIPPRLFTIYPEELKGEVEIDREFDYRPKRYPPHQEVVRIRRVLPIFVESEPSGADVIYVYNVQKDQSEPVRIGEKVLGVTPVFLRIPYEARRLFLQKGYGLQGMVDLDALKNGSDLSQPQKVKVRLKCKKVREVKVAGGISVNDPKSKVEEALGKPILEKDRSGKPITVNGALVWKYPDKGLEVVLRNVSLTGREDWRVDVIRIVSENGGSVEGHYVGEPVDKLLNDQDQLGFPEIETIRGDGKGGKERVLSYVDGGIRFIVDPSTNSVKAIEVARSLEGLKEGITDFAPPRKLRFYVEPFEDRSLRSWPLFAQTITEDLRWVIRQIPTYELVDREEDADYLIRGWVDAESSGKEGEEPVLDPDRLAKVGSNYKAKYRDIDAQAKLHIDLIDLNAIEARDKLVWSRNYLSKRLKYRVYANPEDRPSKGILERILLALIIEVATNPKKKEILEHVKRLIVILGIMALVDRQFRDWIGERIGARRPSIDEEGLARLACLQLMMECVHDLYSIRPLTAPIIAIDRNSGEMEIPIGWREGITRETEFILVNKERESLRERVGKGRMEGEICRLKVVRVEEGRTVVKPDSKKPAEELFRAPDPASGSLQARSTVPKEFKKMLERAREERD